MKTNDKRHIGITHRYFINIRAEIRVFTCNVQVITHQKRAYINDSLFKIFSYRLGQNIKVRQNIHKATDIKYKELTAR